MDPSSNAFGARLLDMALEDGAPRAPLSGLFPNDLPLPSLEDALVPIAAASQLSHLHPTTGRSVKIARKQAKRAQAKHPSLTLDECTAIVLAKSRGQRTAPPRHRADVVSMAWRSDAMIHPMKAPP